MIPHLNKAQTITLVASVGVFLAGLIAVVEYVNTRKHREMQKKNAELENQIKQLTLKKLQVDLNGKA
jgi:hypothetical protein